MKNISYKTINTATIHLLKLACHDNMGTVISTKEALRSGIIFVDENNNMVTELEHNIISGAVRDYGIAKMNWSKTFHKSLAKVTSGCSVMVSTPFSTVRYWHKLFLILLLEPVDKVRFLATRP